MTDWLNRLLCITTSIENKKRDNWNILFAILVSLYEWIDSSFSFGWKAQTNKQKRKILNKNHFKWWIYCLFAISIDSWNILLHFCGRIKCYFCFLLKANLMLIVLSIQCLIEFNLKLTKKKCNKMFVANWMKKKNKWKKEDIAKNRTENWMEIIVQSMKFFFVVFWLSAAK